MKSISRQWVELAKRATAHSIKHWKRMIGWAEKENPKKPVNTTLMRLALHEDWYAGGCLLCNFFMREKGRECNGCPLYIVFGACASEWTMNAWKNVAKAESWGEWVEAAEVMLEQLNTVLMLLGEENV